MASLKILDSPPSYTIAWIAALPIERAAAEAMLDEEHAAPTGLARHQTDTKVYKWGRVGEHNIVIAALASGVYRTTSAAITASSLLASLPSIRTGRLVALGGGVSCPDRGHDIRLGDIVLSQLYGTIGSVCQYYLIKAKLSDKCDRKGFLGCPPTVLLNALASIQDYHERKDSDVPPDCQRCDISDDIQRDPRETTNPDIHYGTLASGNKLVKDAATRERIVTDLGGDFQYEVDGVPQTTIATKAATDFIRSGQHTDKIKHWLSPPDSATNANHARTLCHEGTGAWLLESAVFQSWHLGSHQHVWLYGLAGCGKTVLSVTVLDHLADRNDALILNFFFDFNDITKQSLDCMLRSFDFQLYLDRTSFAIHLDALSEAHQGGRNQPETKVLSKTVFRMLTTQRKTFIVLDALDESKKRDSVLQWIKDIDSQPEIDHVKLFYASRPEPEFLRHIPPLIRKQNCLTFDIQTVDSDIRLWVTALLSQRHNFTEKSLSQDLLRSGASRSNGSG
ncbi:NACHT nucleoside triphosphatase [Penicillium macrosclerotiorum]|uniref:NACHT nucleoside triphosphatase n=1 Tax=Penicillium macrosclerotiorum TaxID=303699 RepID=UPI002549B39C|nr:NACHT nucleoside triphosphatase [Penicillium macrosclerotiorum]KAJ5692952.1 NACHT nucleoside triphosphatase [Penicillium macrosclerotiorum]